MGMYNVRMTEISLATNLLRAYWSLINQMCTMTALLGEEVEADGTVRAVLSAHRCLHSVTERGLRILLDFGESRLTDSVYLT
jgi:hypothetical protein